MDNEGRVARASRLFREWFGEECVGRPIEETLGGASAGLARMLAALCSDQLVGAVARQLRRAGHSVYVAMGVMLGDGDGRRLAERSRAARPDLGIVLISANEGSTVAGSAAPDGILVKPFDLAELVEAMEQHARPPSRAPRSTDVSAASRK